MHKLYIISQFTFWMLSANPWILGPRKDNILEICRILVLFGFNDNRALSVIKIKICAEYWDMQPRPRLVCQEPGLRPIDFNLFYSIHVSFFSIPLRVWLGTWGVASMHSALWYCPLQSEWGWSSDNTYVCFRVFLLEIKLLQSQLPACLAVPWEHSPGIYATGLVKLKDKMDEICNNGKFLIEEPSECRFFCIFVSNFTVFRLESRLVPAVLELGQVRLFWKLIR